MSNLDRDGIRDLGDASFERLRNLIQSETGIHLRDSKRILVSNRLRKRLRALQLDSYDAYYDLLTKTEEGREEMVNFIDAISTNETYFYRGETQFDSLRLIILPELLRTRKKLVIWSAGCSTGEEPYSILIAAEEAAKTLRWTGAIEVTATDVNLSVLAVAKQGIYSANSLRYLPGPYLNAYLDPREDGRFEVKEAIKGNVRFTRQNLLKDDPPKEVVDIIFCRNALMYFTRETQERIVNRCFVPVLAPDGYLFIGSSESFIGMDVDLKYARINSCPIYSRRDPAGNSP